MTAIGQTVFLVTGGVLIGAGVTTLVLKKHYQKIADAEIASVKATYKEHYDKLAGNGTISDVEDDSPWVTPEQTMQVPPIVAPHNPVAYNKVQTSEERREAAEALAANFGYSTATREDPPVVNISKVTVNVPNQAIAETIADLSPAEELELNLTIADEERDPDRPFIISVDEYMANLSEFEQINLTYFAKDKQLADDTDKLIEDVRKTVGYGNLEKFGKMSGNGDTVYVRNKARKVDYEICREQGSYSEDVLNIDDWDNGKKQPTIRKFRDGN